jgi:hypothetical protein
MKRITVEFDRSEISELPMAVLGKIVHSNFRPRQFEMFERLSRHYGDNHARYYVKSILSKERSIQTYVQRIKKQIDKGRPDVLALKKPNTILDQAIERRTVKLTLSKLTRRQLIKYASLTPIKQVEYLKSFTGKRAEISFRKSSNIHEKQPGFFLKLAKQLKDPFSSKSPLKNHLGEWIGVEIECSIPVESVIDYLGSSREVEHNDDCYYEDDNGNFELNGDCDCESESGEGDNKFALGEYLLNNHPELRNYNIKSDGSIRSPSGYFGVEFTVFFTRKDRTPLKNLCKVLSSIGARVNKSCGLHIHLDQRDIINNGAAINRRLKRFKNAVNIMALLVPESRRDNSYCRVAVSTIDGDRYCAVNATAIRKYQTIEIRLHSGTIDFNKINNWIDLNYAISRSEDLNGAEICTSVDELLERAQVSDRVTMFYLKRYQQLNNVETSDDSDYLNAMNTYLDSIENNNTNDAESAA